MNQFVLIKAAQGFAVRRTSVRRSRKPEASGFTSRPEVKA